mmetsp:Transcript_25367/g.17924  ORF Transcript_25367/g.17924 Transcript_25367/m.17924 type:complete len:194 (+) Transcript_25367:28-609(+)
MNRVSYEKLDDANINQSEMVKHTESPSSRKDTLDGPNDEDFIDSDFGSIRTQRPIKFLGLDLKRGIQKKNVSAFLTMMFSVNVIIYFLTSFMVFIIESPDFYDVSPDEAGQLLGNIGFYAELIAIVEGICIGMLFDIIGRRVLICIGVALCGIAIALVPLFKQVYPYFLILRILISVGCIPAVNNPLLPDYVQ